MAGSDRPAGIVFYYIFRMLGLHLKGRVGSRPVEYSVGAVVRGLSLGSLDIAIFASKM